MSLDLISGVFSVHFIEVILASQDDALIASHAPDALIFHETL